MNDAPIKAPLLLKVEDVAELLTVSADSVRNLHRFGLLRGILLGRNLRWRPVDVIRFVEQLTPTEC